MLNTQLIWKSGILEKSELDTEFWKSSAFRRFENIKTAKDRAGREETSLSRAVSEVGGTPAQCVAGKPRRAC